MNITMNKMTELDFKVVHDTLDLSDAGAEILIELKTKNEDLHAISYKNKLVGLALVEHGKRAFLYVYVAPSYRCKGIGSKALELSEQILSKGETKEILACYKTSSTESKAFAEKFCYKGNFQSKYMKYHGEKFNLNDREVANIRDYKKEDYSVAQKLSATAFHQMRVNTGCFPESVVEKPSESSKKYWSETCDQRYILIDKDEIIGHARVVENEIDSLSIKQEHQGKGFGRNFTKFLCNTILNEKHDYVCLYCVVGNKAMFLYESLGFKEVYTAEFVIKQFN